MKELEHKEFKYLQLVEDVENKDYKFSRFEDFGAKERVFKNCDFSYCLFIRAYFRDAKFINCKFIGSSFYDSNLRCKNQSN
jgi:uncharacterized protein YjbI with pentapeptide repeats